LAVRLKFLNLAGAGEFSALCGPALDNRRLQQTFGRIPPKNSAEAFEFDLAAPAPERVVMRRCFVGKEVALEALGRIDVLVNNAAIAHRSAWRSTDPASICRVKEVNFFGSAHCARAALDALRESRGLIIAISSVAGEQIDSGFRNQPSTDPRYANPCFADRRRRSRCGITQKYCPSAVAELGNNSPGELFLLDSREASLLW